MSAQPWYAAVPRSTRHHILAGMVITGVAVLGFSAWSATAPIAGAIITSGAFVASGQNKTIQHLEGGVIREIKVHEGDIVEAGQTLVVLDDTTPKAELRRLTLKLARLEAVEARLKAEIDWSESIDVPQQLQESEEPEVVTIVENQRLTSEVLQLQRARLALQGEVGRLTGDIGDTRERMARAREQISGLRNGVVKLAIEQLQDIRADLFDTRERLMTARGILDRVRITAPVRGAVVKLRYHTPGGVVEPGRSIMEVLPLRDELLIEVRVRPQDIDSVKRGNTAMVRLTALNQRITPMVSGEVVYVSADALSEEGRVDKSTRDTYIARVRLANEEVTALPHFTPTPGMPAEVYIRTSDRTFFQYLAKPVRDTMSRAFREP